MFDFGPELGKFSPVGFCLKFKHLLGSKTKLFALLEFTFEEEMLSQILQGEGVSGVGLEGSVEKMDCLFARFETVLPYHHLNDAKGRECH